MVPLPWAMVHFQHSPIDLDLLSVWVVYFFKKNLQTTVRLINKPDRCCLYKSTYRNITLNPPAMGAAWVTVSLIYNH